MRIYHATEHGKLYCGDSIEVLKAMASQSVNCCVTSPPYFALRDYGVDGQLGLEPTIDEYIDRLCNVFDEVKRVLRDDGTLWVNLGDTYGGSGNGTGDYRSKADMSISGKRFDYTVKAKTNNFTQPKSLCQIPSRFAIEMCNRGWILRNEIIWHKPNCMPSSAKDRFTVDFEKIFFFVKQQKYWFETQTEPIKTESIKRNLRGNNENKYSKEGFMPGGVHANTMSLPREYAGYGDLNKIRANHPGRNKRAVWRVTTKGYKEAHFATYPLELIETPIKAGCPVGGIVLDPFFGSGTTAIEALRQNKRYIGIDLNPEYCEIAAKRIDKELEQTSI